VKPTPEDVIREFGSRRDALRCAPEDKAALEAQNSAVQHEYIQDCVQKRDSRQVRENDVIELQRIAIEGIYPCGGGYRTSNFDMVISGSRHQPPAAAQLHGYVLDMLEWCNDAKRLGSVRVAYCLWRFNWLHPFPGGNGRSARALCYLVLAFDLGVLPPGIPSLMERIKENQEGYLSALQAVDALFASGNDEEIDPGMPAYLRPMHDFLSPLVLEQLGTAIATHG
jgi:Fic family protein